MEKQNQHGTPPHPLLTLIYSLDAPNLSIRREIISEECRKISRYVFLSSKILINFSHIPREAYFMTRRFDVLAPVHSDSEFSPKDNCPYINQILEIAGAPNLESALYNIDQLTGNPANISNGQVKMILDGFAKKL